MINGRFSALVAPLAIAAGLFGFATPSNPPQGTVQVGWNNYSLKVIFIDTSGFNYWAHGQDTTKSWVDNRTLNWKIGVQGEGKEFNTIYYTSWAYIQSGSEYRSVYSQFTQRHRVAY